MLAECGQLEPVTSQVLYITRPRCQPWCHSYVCSLVLGFSLFQCTFYVADTQRKLSVSMCISWSLTWIIDLTLLITKSTAPDPTALLAKLSAYSSFQTAAWLRRMMLKLCYYLFCAINPKITFSYLFTLGQLYGLMFLHGASSNILSITYLDTRPLCLKQTGGINTAWIITLCPCFLWHGLQLRDNPLFTNELIMVKE